MKKVIGLLILLFSSLSLLQANSIEKKVYTYSNGDSCVYANYKNTSKRKEIGEFHFFSKHSDFKTPPIEGRYFPISFNDNLALVSQESILIYSKTGFIQKIVFDTAQQELDLRSITFSSIEKKLFVPLKNKTGGIEIIQKSEKWILRFNKKLEINGISIQSIKRIYDKGNPTPAKLSSVYSNYNYKDFIINWLKTNNPEGVESVLCYSLVFEIDGIYEVIILKNAVYNLVQLHSATRFSILENGVKEFYNGKEMRMEGKTGFVDFINEGNYVLLKKGIDW